MRNLARHIEHLLRDNDCVILPGFGGFIAQAVPAYYMSKEALFYPPSRNISFNAAITMNDGLLAQSYMKSYQVDYARANYMVDMAIEQLRDTLDEEGTVVLPHIGTIKQDIYQSIQFMPEEAGISSPHHFGLGSFLIKELHQLHQSSETQQQHQPIITHTAKTINLHINKNMLRQVMSTAAVLLLLLMVSLPTGNHKPTDIASLHLTNMITVLPAAQQEMGSVHETDAIESTSNKGISIIDPTVIIHTTNIPAVDMPASDVTVPASPFEASQILAENSSQPTEIATEVPQADAMILPKKVYHIIVASLPNHRGAEETLNQYIDKGYLNASLVERDNRIRISLTQFTNKTEANSYLSALRTKEGFANAWLLAVSN